MSRPNDLSRSLVPFEQNSTLVAVLELSQSSWLVAGTVPGVERQPLKKLDPDEQALLQLLRRWQEEAARAGRTVTRIAVAYEAGRDGFWLARWLRARGIEVHVIHPTSVAISREHKRAKTDRLDTAMLMRVFLGWLRGERGHCGMVAVPSAEEEDAKRPSREREGLVGERTRIVNRMKGALARLGIRGFKPELRRAPERLEALRTPEGLPIPPNTLDEFRRDLARLAMLREQIAAIEQARLERLEQAPRTGPHAMVRLLASITGLGVETADMLVQEVLSRNLRDRRAVARYAGLTGSPDESGSKRRDKGLAKSGNARVRRGLIQLAWRFLGFLALPRVPEGERAGAVVSRADRPGRAQDNHDRRPRQKAAHRLVAHGHHRRGSARRRAAASGLIAASGADTYGFGVRPRSCGRPLTTVRGGGDPSICMASMPR
jgi:transposase